MTGPALRFPFDAPPGEGEAVRVADGVLWLRLPLPAPLGHVNVYALEDATGWTVIDTGLNTRHSRAVWDSLLAGPLAGRPVVRVVVTHHHPDHVGLAGWFQSRGAELVTTRTAWLYARMLQLDEQPLPVPETLAFWHAAGMQPELLARRAAERPFNFCDVVAPMPPGFTGITEGDILTMADRRWQVRLGHGHAPDHATFWSMDDDLVLGGDQMLPGISANIGVYPTEPEADPLTDWLESCATLHLHARPGHLVLPGHKLPFTGLPLRLAQMIDGHAGTLNRLQTHLATPQTAVGCFPALYRRPIGAGEYGLALVEAVAHLNHLLRRGLVQRSRGPDGAWLWQNL